MKTKYFILPLVALGVAFTSCKDDMDYNEYVVVDKDYVEQTFGNVGGFMTQLYKAVEYDFGNFNGGAMSASATDEAEFSQLSNTITDFYNGAWSPTNAHQTTWNNMFSAIQQANHYIDFWQGLEFSDYELNADYAGQMNRYRNYYYEARFLRAYYYFILNRQYGGVPLLKEGMSASEINSLERNTSDEVFEYIFKELDEIKDKIIVDYGKLGEFALGSTENGRANKLSVLALRARATLYWASPLFNPSGDKKRYEEAAKCYSDLFTQMTTAYNAEDPQKGGNGYRFRLVSKYEDLWASDSYSKAATYNTIFYGYRYGNITGGDNYVETHNYPVGINGGSGGNCPTQNLVDAYEMQKTGKPITDPKSGHDPKNPYAGRDPRLASTVAVNGDVWPTYQKVALETFQGGVNAQPLANATTTGYYLKKLCNGAINLSSNSTYKVSYHTFLNFRLGGALLDYAEAVYQATGNADDQIGSYKLTAREAVNMVRTRVKMPKITESGAEFWAKLQNERFVELAFEGHRFWDVRRWKEGSKYFTSITRMIIKKNEDGTFTYTPQTVNRQWNERNNFFPIPQTEIMKNPNLKQNEGW